MFVDMSTGEVGECTGTLLAPRLVLTARHCVSKTDEGALCDPSGKAIQGARVYSDHPASSLYVFTGTKRPNIGFSKNLGEQGRGASIFVPDAKTLCNNDIALVVLKDPVENAQIAPIRLDADVGKSEIITSVGWGETEKTQQPPVRMQRTGVKVLEVGPGREASSNEFIVGESICSGDSGGPAISDKGSVLGVVSRGGNGGGGSGASACLNAQNIYTKVEGFKDLILSAYAEAGQDPWLEGQPDPRLAKLGETCDGDDKCRSAFCDLSGKDGGVCGQKCDDGSACPDGTTCTAGVCKAPQPKSSATSNNNGGGGGGCSTGNQTPVGSLALFALVGLGVAAVGRRRRGV
jgi:MYXO-CTERM domain-containing protein